MSDWSSKTKAMRRVGEVWLDPIDVSAAEQPTPGTTLFHLRNGSTVETRIPDGKTLDWMLARLFGEDE